MQLEDMRTISVLRSAAPAPEAIARLPDRVLRAAVQNPDHSEAGRAAAAEVLRARGVTVAPWSIAAPGFIRSDDLRRGDAPFFGAGRAVRSVVGAATLVAAAALIAAVAAPKIFEIIKPNAALIAAGAVVVLAALWFLTGLARLHPARLCCVGQQSGFGGRRMLARELRVYGHVITLSAKDGAGAVRDAASYRACAARLHNLPLMNLRTMCADAQTLTVRAAPRWRAMVARLLAGSCDALVVDLSGGAPDDWDSILPQSPRCVFVSAWAQHEQAEAVLAGAGIARPCFFYAPDGEMQRRGQFRAALLAAMRAARGA
jgi:hypothetical protein